MNAETFAEWLRRQGHHVVKTRSTYWHDQGPRCYQAFPYHWIIQPAEEETQGFLRSHKALSLRYSTSVAAAAGRLSYHMTYEKPTYGFDDLGRWARKNVRRGLKNCSVEPITFERLAAEGWVLQEDTLGRQKRTSSLSPAAWNRLSMAAATLPGFEAWGALVSGQLAASVITLRVEDCCYMLYQQCRREYLPAHVNNALSFSVTREMIGRDEIRSVFYCLHSLDAPSTMDEFKLRMGYTAKAVCQRVVFHPWCSPFINGATHAALRRAVALRPSSQLLRKGEGMVRFYREGQQPIEQQNAPEALRWAGGAEE